MKIVSSIWHICKMFLEIDYFIQHLLIILVINRCMCVFDTNNYFLIYEKTLQFSRGPSIPILYPHKPWSTCTAYTYIGMSIDRDYELLETRPAFTNMWSNCKRSKGCLRWYLAFSTTRYRGRNSVTITPNVCLIEWWFVFDAANETETTVVYTRLYAINWRYTI